MNAHISINSQVEPIRYDVRNDGPGFVNIDGINVFNTEAALAEHAKNLATPHLFQVGDLVDLHFTRHGHFEAVVLERYLFAPGPSGGRSVKLLFTDAGEIHTIIVPERCLKLIQPGYLTEDGVAARMN
ncbi:hypothetical protein G7039_01415 [Rhizobium leguminosarum]|nr:hypothetical protein G7039_01415 [Rhizobium leguminosarum]